MSKARVAGTEPDSTEFQTGRVTTIAGGHAVHDTFTAFLPPLLPRFIENLSLSNTAAGALSAFLQLPSLLQPAIGHIADRRALRRIVVSAPAVTATAMSLLDIQVDVIQHHFVRILLNHLLAFYIHLNLQKKEPNLDSFKIEMISI